MRSLLFSKSIAKFFNAVLYTQIFMSDHCNRTAHASTCSASVTAHQALRHCCYLCLLCVMEIEGPAHASTCRRQRHSSWTETSMRQPTSNNCYGATSCRIVSQTGYSRFADYMFFCKDVIIIIKKKTSKDDLVSSILICIQRGSNKVHMPCLQIKYLCSELNIKVYCRHSTL